MDAFKRLGWTCACAGLYYLAFRFAWFHSADQFFLPAGLRIACLLFLPYRLWPSIFIGDAAAMLSLRIPFAEANNFPVSWAYCSALLFSPVLSLGALALRRYWPAAYTREKYLPFTLLALAVWGVAANIALNALFSGPIESPLATYAYKVSTGQFLTSIVAVLPIMVWLRRAEVTNWNRLIRDSLLCVGALLSTYFGAGLVEESWQRLALLGMMILPALTLTVLHGWRGAAIGVVAANVSLGLSIPSTGLFGNRDLDVFVAQQTLAVMGTSLLLVGAAMSKEFDRNRLLVHATREQRLLARADHLSAEQSLRARAEAIAEAQQRISCAYRETVSRLRQGGHYALAMHINAESVASTRIVYQQASDLYPFQLENSGLFAVLRSAEFARKWAGGSAEFRLTGSIAGHSLAFQLVAYRCICHAIEMLPCKAYRVSVKAGHSQNPQWIAVVVASAERRSATRTKASRMAQVQLSAKLQAYGGRHRFERRKVAILLTDLDHGLSNGTTIQDSFLAPFTTLTTKSSEL
ncbi:MASE1 domain-containing protein [Xanthomonas translucens]|uniref:MASE1 domain-containing protein n=1 Tax=Xanthomonas campestris pv. translucens TaxID=343 RepID=UPI00071E918E|nr:MASE1 domain-containing protein [Xanthomonas translucens]WLA02776.1 MASE1 domain-containing protein [Xanthomonas translucens]